MYKWSKVHELSAGLTAREVQIKTEERGDLTPDTCYLSKDKSWQKRALAVGGNSIVGP